MTSEKIVKLQWKYTVQCKHVHVSGRRCGQRVPKTRAERLCDLHPKPLHHLCEECRSMMAAFEPPKGWNDAI